MSGGNRKDDGVNVKDDSAYSNEVVEFGTSELDKSKRGCWHYEYSIL